MGHGARTSRDETILGFSGLVRSIARRYAGRGFPLDDLVQVGYLGLIQAVDRFDPSRGTSLRAYAARTIDGEIMHMFRDQKWAIRIPRGLQESSTRVVRMREELTQSLGREPTVAEIADASGLSREETWVLLHDLVTVHRLVTELEGTDTPDLGPRFEEKPRL
jgi:RNA polymerase sigma-B factor